MADEEAARRARIRANHLEMLSVMYVHLACDGLWRAQSPSQLGGSVSRIA
jgi:hypothetical protein